MSNAQNEENVNTNNALNHKLLNFRLFLAFLADFADPGVGLNKTMMAIDARYDQMLERRHRYGTIETKEEGEQPWQRTGKVSIQLGTNGGSDGLVRWVTPYGQEILFHLGDYNEATNSFVLLGVAVAKQDKGEDNWLVDHIIPTVVKAFADSVESEVLFTQITLEQSRAAFDAATSELKSRRQMKPEQQERRESVLEPVPLAGNRIKIRDITEAGEDS